MASSYLECCGKTLRVPDVTLAVWAYEVMRCIVADGMSAEFGVGILWAQQIRDVPTGMMTLGEDKMTPADWSVLDAVLGGCSVRTSIPVSELREFGVAEGTVWTSDPLDTTRMQEYFERLSQFFGECARSMKAEGR